jgi:hypothetical protein
MVHASLMGFCHLNEFSAATAIERGRLKVVFNIRRACLRQLAICLVVLAQFSAIRSYAQQAAKPPDRPLTLDQAIDCKCQSKRTVDRLNRSQHDFADA